MKKYYLLHVTWSEIKLKVLLQANWECWNIYIHEQALQSVM